jgi:hypothetical protein
MKNFFLALLLFTTAAYAQAQGTPDHAAQKAELVEKVFSEQSYLYSQIIDKCFTFRLSPTCWEQFNNPNQGNRSGFGAMRYWCRFVTGYAKREGFGDLEALSNSSDRAVEKGNRPQMDEIIAQLSKKFSLTLEAEKVACNPAAYDRLMRYPFETLDRIGSKTPEWSPKSGEAHLTVVLSPTVKDIAVTMSPDGKKFTVAGPYLTEGYDSGSKIWNGLARGDKNR